MKEPEIMTDQAKVIVTEGEGEAVKNYLHTFRRPTPTERIRYNRDLAEAYYPSRSGADAPAEMIELDVNSRVAEARVKWYARLIAGTDGYGTAVALAPDGIETPTTLSPEGSIMMVPVSHQTHAVRALFEEKKTGPVSAKLAPG